MAYKSNCHCHRSKPVVERSRLDSAKLKKKATPNYAAALKKSRQLTMKTCTSRKCP